MIGAIRQQDNKRAGRTMLILADPVFNSNDARARGAASATQRRDSRAGIQSALTDLAGQAAAPTAESAKMQGLPLARLAGTRTEAEQIGKLAKASGTQADVWLDLDASEDNLEARDISKYRVLHIATHGLLNAERPQFTGLVLTLVGNKTEDGFLRTDEVFNLRLGSPLVMLSACETGLGKEKRGEGVMGLTRAFMYAGAPTVGVSLWSVAGQINRRLDDRLLQTPVGHTRLRVHRRLRVSRHARCATRDDRRQEIQRAILLGAVCPRRRLAVRKIVGSGRWAVSRRQRHRAGGCTLSSEWAVGSERWAEGGGSLLSAFFFLPTAHCLLRLCTKSPLAQSALLQIPSASFTRPARRAFRPAVLRLVKLERDHSIRPFQRPFRFTRWEGR